MLTAWEADEALIKLLGQYSQNSPHVLREGQGLREETEQDRRRRLAYGTEDWHWVRWVAYPALTVPHSYGREALTCQDSCREKFLIRVLAGIVLEYTGPPIDRSTAARPPGEGSPAC